MIKIGWLCGKGIPFRRKKEFMNEQLQDSDDLLIGTYDISETPSKCIIKQINSQSFYQMLLLELLPPFLWIFCDLGFKV